MKKITYLFICTIILCNKIATAMNQGDIHLMVVPGQNGLGGGNIDTVIPHFADKPGLKHNIQTPRIRDGIDFGQTRCQSYLHKKMSSLKNNDKAIIHGSSQGTATTGIYTAKHPEKVGAIILEAVMLSGNSAIFHAISNRYPKQCITSLPGSYYWLPYLAKFVYPFYSPAGEQLVVTAHKLPKDLPIIILHHAKDPQLSHEGAQALYAFLKHVQGNENVYLMSKDSYYGEHVELLDNISCETNIQKINAINKILHQHTLLPEYKDSPFVKSQFMKFTRTELQDYQPKPKQKWLDHFNDILTKENRIWYIDWGVKTAFYSLIAYIIYRTGLAEKCINRIQSTQ